MGEIGFGYDIGSLHQDVPFANAFNKSQAMIEEVELNPFLNFLPFKKEFQAHIKTMHDFIYNIINEKRKSKDLGKKKDLLSRFMSLTDEETGQPFSDDYLRDVVMNFFIAGRDTTACLLSWACYLLSKNEDKAEKLFEEIYSKFKGSSPTSIEDFKDLTYLQQVLDETLRLYPSVPFDGRTAVKDDILPTGHKIKAGTMCGYSAYCTGRSTKIWGPDALEFRPERFDEDYPKEAFYPFHLGPQLCLGRSMAYLEAKTMLSMLIQRFTFTLAPGAEVKPIVSIVLPAKDPPGVPLIFAERELLTE
eukprot:CAMPEP_0174261378 /NCGR_PEP_ID=MMETSP0439-20130205/11393_1 /TAXON_ID=0 /ORGANISM="Stereomyxa ramosa, Strain Chinc5" /LENGTH=303 /DNA_ID=CAMNT_0015345841 /DNA_START=559 /DNA_END=1470 /DNA_ORIENTATION=-